MNEITPNFYKPKEIKKMIDPREKAKEIIAAFEQQLQEEMEKGNITTNDIEEMLEKNRQRRSSETVH